jgi:hypothetical protein
MYPRPPGAPPCGAKLSVVRPHARVLLPFGDSGKVAVRPVRLVLRITGEPPEDFEPELRLVFDGKGYHPDLSDQTLESERDIRRDSTGTSLRQHRFAENDPALVDAVQVGERFLVQTIAWITKSDERVVSMKITFAGRGASRRCGGARHAGPSRRASSEDEAHVEEGHHADRKDVMFVYNKTRFVDLLETRLPRKSDQPDRPTPTE